MKLYSIIEKINKFDSTYPHYRMQNAKSFEQIKNFANKLKVKGKSKLKKHRVIRIQRFKPQWMIIDSGDYNWDFGIKLQKFLTGDQGDRKIEFSEKIHQ